MTFKLRSQECTCYFQYVAMNKFSTYLHYLKLHAINWRQFPLEKCRTIPSRSADSDECHQPLQFLVRQSKGMYVPEHLRAHGVRWRGIPTQFNT